MRGADRSPEVDDAAPIRLGLNSRQFIGSRGQVVRWIAAADWYGPQAQPIPAYEAPPEATDDADDEAEAEAPVGQIGTFRKVLLIPSATQGTTPEAAPARTTERDAPERVRKAARYTDLSAYGATPPAAGPAASQPGQQPAAAAALDASSSHPSRIGTAQRDDRGGIDAPRQ